MTSFNLARLDPQCPDQGMLDEIGVFFEQEGYCILHGLKETVTDLYYPALMRATGVGRGELEAMLDPESPDLVLSQEFRRILSRVTTTPELTQDLIARLSPLLGRLLGPVVHTSRDFHAQFKCGATARVGYGGYDSQQSYMEVHGAYQLHQDFTGASIPTSPAAVILWVGLNDCSDWPIRLHRRSHNWYAVLALHPRGSQRVTQFGEPLEFEAKPGTGIIFNSLLLHGTGRGGPRRRVSSDIRFFPSCPYLSSPPRPLVGAPADFIRQRLQRETGETLRAPLLENLALAGSMGKAVEAPKASILNWANYLNEVCNGDAAAAVTHLERFANAELGMDSVETYVKQFHGSPMNAGSLERIREVLGVGRGEPVAIHSTAAEA